MDSFAQTLRTFVDIGFGCCALGFAFEGIHRKAPRWIIAIRLAFLAVAATHILQDQSVIRLPIPAVALQLMMTPLVILTMLTAGREPRFWRRWTLFAWTEG